MSVDLRKSLLLRNSSTKYDNTSRRNSNVKIPLSLQAKIGGGSTQNLAKAVKKLITAKRFFGGSIGSRIGSIQSLDFRVTGEKLEPDFSNGYKFSYAITVDAALNKYSNQLERENNGFQMPSSEVKICKLPYLYDDYTLMRDLKERDSTSPDRRKKWTYNVNYKSPGPQLKVPKGTGYKSASNSRPASTQSTRQSYGYINTKNNKNTESNRVQVRTSVTKLELPSTRNNSSFSMHSVTSDNPPSTDRLGHSRNLQPKGYLFPRI